MAAPIKFLSHAPIAFESGYLYLEGIFEGQAEPRYYKVAGKRRGYWLREVHKITGAYVVTILN